MNQLDVVTFGEAMAMFMANETGALDRVDHYSRELAGAETNFAIGMARLGYTSGWASKVGDDAFGRYIVRRLQEESVNSEHVLVTDEYPTGFQIKSKVLEGDPEVQYFRKGSAASHLDPNDLVASYFKSSRHLHMTGIPLALSPSTCAFASSALELMKQTGKSISFDPNLRPSLWKSKEEMVQTINKFAVQTDAVLPGLEEGQILTGLMLPEDIAAFYLDKGVKAVVIKLGSKGAYYRSQLEEGYVKGIAVEKVIDTVGAGDGFAVGFVSGLLDEVSLQEAVRRGNTIGALAVQSNGDNDGYPTRNKLNECLDTNLYEGVK